MGSGPVVAGWIVSSLSILLLCVELNAQSSGISGSTAGIFTNPAVQGNAVVSGVGTDAFTWGQPVGTGPNRLSFHGATISAEINEDFSLGVLDYFNGTTKIGTNPAGVDLKINFIFSMPFVTPQEVTAGFTFTSTPNNSRDPDTNADFVRFSDFPTMTFTDTNGAEYTLVIQRFPDGT